MLGNICAADLCQVVPVQERPIQRVRIKQMLSGPKPIVQEFFEFIMQTNYFH
jgi:hypothetical protein